MRKIGMFIATLCFVGLVGCGESAPPAKPNTGTGTGTNAAVSTEKATSTHTATETHTGTGTHTGTAAPVEEKKK